MKMDASTTVGKAHTPINRGTPDGSDDAAMNYYKNTVFEVVSLGVRKVSKTYALFEVTAKRGGVTVEPNSRVRKRGMGKGRSCAAGRVLLQH